MTLLAYGQLLHITHTHTVPSLANLTRFSARLAEFIPVVLLLFCNASPFSFYVAENLIRSKFAD